MRVLSYIYAFVTSFRNFLYDNNILKTHKVEDVEILCVGNIAVGGTGKTPAVQFFIKKLQKEGKKVAVVSRGYRGKRKEEPCLVSDGKTIFVTAKESGDEPYIHAFNLKVPVIVGKDRHKACLFAKRKFHIDTIVLDDGFQHRRLYRDRDIVLLDASDPYGGGHVLPWGKLREDFIKAGKRASEFIITKADSVKKEEIEKIKKELEESFHKRVSVAKHAAKSLQSLEGENKELSFIQGKKVLLFSALANPGSFEKTVYDLGATSVQRIDYPDHYAFQQKDFTLLEEKIKGTEVDCILTTEKDFVKFPKNVKIKNMYVLKIEFILLEDNTGK